eukprot:NODE_4165_length_704_cov_2.830508.p3 GENE.NODE_4165_length_704_cov_2.830508~~NODE_4165_length_704_cov_2.830508.p3  ORF type:complete len:66 (-),score=8.35 NODE_4165_length_704_cov_2.830508:475-672(-)
MNEDESWTLPWVRLFHGAHELHDVEFAVALHRRQLLGSHPIAEHLGDAPQRPGGPMTITSIIMFM